MTDRRFESAAIELRYHQQEARDATLSALSVADRTQIHMCCGSGKTFVQASLASHAIRQADKPEDATIVCYVPNRDLIAQNAENFRKIFGDEVDVLGVCSPKDTGSQTAQERERAAKTPVSTDPDEIAGFLNGSTKPRIVFATYQSAPTFSRAVANAGPDRHSVDLGLMDEAHRTAGDKSPDSLFAHTLYDENIDISKRAFFTATPRIAEGPDTGGNVLSMADPDLYGHCAYTYPFSRGIEDKYVAPYDMWVPVISRQELSRFMSESGFEEQETRQAVAALALGKIMEETGQSRFLTYHNRISDSQAFAAHLEGLHGDAGYTIGHVDGTTPGAERERLLGELESGSALVTNCKDFLEGVDVPGLQGVLFVDPKSSVVDVVQAMGRAGRPDPNDPDKRSSIVAPILVDSTDPDEIARQAKASGFETLIQVAQAMTASDDAMSDDIKDRSRAIGRGDAAAEAPLKGLKVIAATDDISEERAAGLEKSITMMSIDAMRDTFAERVGNVERHLRNTGALPTTKSDPSLAGWISDTRRKHREGRLDPEQAKMLDATDGWSWVGARDDHHKVASTINAFYERNRRMPDRKSRASAERDIGMYAYRADSAHATSAHQGAHGNVAGGSDRKTAAKDAFVANLSRDLDQRGLIYRSEGASRPVQAGHIRRAHAPETGREEIYFVPSGQTASGKTPMFRSGVLGAPKPIRLQLDAEQKERLDQVPDDNSVKVVLGRAGIEKSPYRDGRLDEIQGANLFRGKEPDAPNTVSWLVNRLKDRKFSGEPEYSRENLSAGSLDTSAPATAYTPAAAKGSIGDAVMLIERVRKREASGKLADAQARQLDAAPGFSWIDQDRVKDRLGGIVSGIARRHGTDVLSDAEARRGDTGLANTLRTMDTVLARGRTGSVVEAEVSGVGDAEIRRTVTSRRDALSAAGKQAGSRPRAPESRRTGSAGEMEA